MLRSPITDADKLFDIKTIEEQYESLSDLKQVFTKSLDEEIEDQEIDKTRRFNKAQLNIKLDRFGGYDSNTDFYTFKTNFEKLHLQSTPRKLLPDLLKNNYLAEPALTLIKTLDDIDTIWKRLKDAYGDAKVMLSRKLHEISKHDLIKTTNAEKLTTELGKVINMMLDTGKLAKDHHIEEHLYYGDGFTRICHLIGDRRTTKFLGSTCDDNPSPKDMWYKLVTFLEREKKVNQTKMRFNQSRSDTTNKDERKVTSGNSRRFNTSTAHAVSTPYPSPSHGASGSKLQQGTITCQICGSKEGVADHISSPGPGGSRILQYFTCKQFVDASPATRLKLIKEKGFCFQCLLPGTSSSYGKHAEGRCQRDFSCPHPSHDKYSTKKHVLVCEDHKTMECNKELLQKFTHRFIRSPMLPEFSKNINLSHHVEDCYKVTNEGCVDRGIYLLQEITVDNNKLLIFFDNGCSDFIVSRKAVQLLGSRATQKSSEPIKLGGVGNTITKSSYGMYNIQLPLHDGIEVTLSGACLHQITAKFPIYPLTTAEKDIKHHYALSGGSNNLPSIPTSIGGEVHMMIGIKYLRYHPKMLFQLPSGLAIYQSSFTSSPGGRGVIGGPHPTFSEIHQSHISNINPETSDVSSTFFTDEYKAFCENVNSDVPLLGYSLSHSDVHLTDSPDVFTSHSLSTAHLSKAMRIFEEVEATGSEITYRCPQCRSCKTCKHDNNEFISIKEEVEQTIINNSVHVDASTKTAVASLPFIADPSTRLANNKGKAVKVYNQQIKKLSITDKQDIIDSEGKLQRLGFVDYVKNLPTQTQLMLKNHQMQHFLPWRAVWKGNSVSTPCRVVFDASMATSSGYSLNDILAKGRNNLNNLQEILIRWSTKPTAIHTDITKMYNTIQLKESDWCYQRYLWQDGLELGKQPEEKIVKTLIYGVKSSGNQAEYGLRKIAELLEDNHPEVKKIVHQDVYVDDVITGEKDIKTAHARADELELVLNHGSFKLKGIAFSGEDPPETLSDDGETIHVGGMKWFAKSDELSLNIDELNFTKKSRGKKPAATTNIVPERLTRRHCASKVAEVFDLTGKVSPLVAAMKLDLQEIVKRRLDWDDAIPDNLKPLWETHFQMIQEIGKLRYKRAIVPVDAVTMDVNTIDFGDASPSMACIAIYARFLRRNGQYSCQLILSRTRSVPKEMSQPRGELYAALINSHTGKIVRRSLREFHQSALKLTDSQIALYWIDGDEKPLHQWVRNRVIEIRRFAPKLQWHYINTKHMIADLGTRRGATIADVDSFSTWINGYDWMKLDISQFPIISAQDLRLDDSQKSEAQKESHLQVHHSNKLSSEVEEHYRFSNYVIDPNYRSFSKVIRILAYVIKFKNSLQQRIKNNAIKSSKGGQAATTLNDSHLNNEEIQAAESYFFQKATSEIIHFLQPKKYEPISMMKDGILFYNGRILPDSKITIVGRYTEAMLDLSATSFCVPLLDNHSPIAFSIVSDVHWNSQSSHAGIETTLRQVMKKAFIIGGRSLVKTIKNSCKRCKYLNKRTVEAVMGPVPDSSLTIAPAFYHTQLDLSGPYKAYSPHHKRTTIKIWLVVYCCCATSAVVINVMDDYSTTAFIQSFTRFSARYGFPKKAFCDEGSQLLKGSKDMRLQFTDIKSKLQRDRNIEFQTCPVGAHNVNGKVERKIKEVNESLDRSLKNDRLSILQWETLSAVIANTINDLPIAMGNVIDVENMDLLTPNRLMLGRNNDRSPTGQFITSQDTSKILNQNTKIYDAWFESWLLNHVPKLMNQQKWFKHERNLRVGDIVLFTKVESSISKTYTYGMVSDTDVGNDGNVRRVTVKYQNANENVPRQTSRSVRGLVVINSVDECDVMKDIGEMAKNVDIELLKC